jgi:hypothetical protein
VVFTLANKSDQQKTHVACLSEPSPSPLVTPADPDEGGMVESLKRRPISRLGGTRGHMACCWDLDPPVRESSPWSFRFTALGRHC